MNAPDLLKAPLLVSAPSANRHLQVTKENQKHTGARKKTQQVVKDNLDNLLYDGRKSEGVNGYLHNSNPQTLSGRHQNLLQLHSNNEINNGKDKTISLYERDRQIAFLEQELKMQKMMAELEKTREVSREQERLLKPRNKNNLNYELDESLPAHLR